MVPPFVFRHSSDRVGAHHPVFVAGELVAESEGGVGVGIRGDGDEDVFAALAALGGGPEEARKKLSEYEAVAQKPPGKD